jgi:hypothetical protein
VAYISFTWLYHLWSLPRRMNERKSPAWNETQKDRLSKQQKSIKGNSTSLNNVKQINNVTKTCKNRKYPIRYRSRDFIAEKIHPCEILRLLRRENYNVRMCNVMFPSTLIEFVMKLPRVDSEIPVFIFSNDGIWTHIDVCLALGHGRKTRDIIEIVDDTITYSKHRFVTNLKLHFILCDVSFLSSHIFTDALWLWDRFYFTFWKYRHFHNKKTNCN